MKKTVMKYNIGDRVILLDARNFRTHSHYIWISGMDKYIGAVLTVSKHFPRYNSYGLSGEGLSDGWGFPEEWLKLYNYIHEWNIKDEFFEI